MGCMKHTVISAINAHTSVITPDFDDFVGRCDAMHQLYAMLRAAACAPCPVFLSGESGTGKDLAARSLHAQSTAAHKPFVMLNCATLTPELMDSEIFGHRRGAFTGAVQDRAGLLDQAEGGTLFLDEVTELPIHLQAKLLHVVDSGHYRRLGEAHQRHASVRIVAASNRDITAARRQGFLRDDLFYRLSALHITLPPLRLRGRDDILRLSEYLLARIAAHLARPAPQLDASAQDWLAAQPWQGNVRSLNNALRHAAVFFADASVLSARHLQQPQHTPDSTPQLATAERLLIEHTITAHGGNLRAAARTLGINPSTLHRKIKRWQQQD